MDEPVKHFYKLIGFDRANIRKCVIGEKYVAIMNSHGNIGVCSTLGNRMNDGILSGEVPDLDDPVHRIILNAYFNSICNYERDYEDTRDIFDSIDFSKHHRIVMVGYFESLYQKFYKKGIHIEVFDIHKKSHIMTDISKLEESLSGAESIILSGTTIFNNTFNGIMDIVPAGSNIFLLGPSNILSEEFFRYPCIKVVFGSVFGKDDHRVMELFDAGHGTRGVLPYLKKVYIVRDDYRYEIQ